MDQHGESSRPNRMHVDTFAVAANTRRVLDILGATVGLIACVKANAYGHGSVAVADAAVRAGAAGLAVGDLESAARLRQAGLAVPLIVYSGVRWDGDALAVAARLDLIVTVVDADQARAIAAAARSPQQVLLEVDVGHERLGVPAEEAATAVASVRRLRMLRWAGVLAHVYDRPQRGDRAIQRQLDRMTGALDALEALGPLPRYRIAASSGPLSRQPGVHFDSRLNFADPGRLLLGLAPPAAAARLGLQTALASLESELIQVRELTAVSPPGGPDGRAGARRIGVFPMGRSDGLGLVHTGQVIVGGSLVPIIGEWIDHTTVALADVPSARAGDPVVIIGRQGGRSIGVQDVLRAHRRLRMADVAMSLQPSVPRVPAASVRAAG